VSPDNSLNAGRDTTVNGHQVLDSSDEPDDQSSCLVSSLLPHC
jgi:hypothetical protein